MQRQNDLKKGPFNLLWCRNVWTFRCFDAIELTPTYSVSPERAFGILAGGEKAMYQAIEGAEDSKELAIEDLTQHQLTARDVVIAIAASGRTPYAVSAIEYGKSGRSNHFSYL